MDAGQGLGTGEAGPHPKESRIANRNRDRGRLDDVDEDSR